MAKYLVTYDLVGEDETSADYERLIAAIKTYSCWGKIRRSAWVIKTADISAEIRDKELKVVAFGGCRTGAQGGTRRVRPEILPNNGRQSEKASDGPA